MPNMLSMDGSEFYIFQNDNGEIFAHTTDASVAHDYIRFATGLGYTCLLAKHGIATIVTLANAGK